MRVAIIAAVAGLVMGGAAELQAAPPVAAEAHLQGCVAASDPLCAASADAFRRDWPRAWAGEYQAQVNVSAYLAPRGAIDGAPAVRPDPMLACAWALLVLRHPQAQAADAAYARARCRAPAVDQAEAERTAAEMARRIGGPAAVSARRP